MSGVLGLRPPSGPGVRRRRADAAANCRDRNPFVHAVSPQQGDGDAGRELVLGDRDPLPLLISQGVADDDAITAWTCALLGFADATCIELEPSAPTARLELAVTPRRRASSVFRRRSSMPTLPRTQRWPRHLEPVGHWIRYSGSFVAGHRRRLNDGKTATDEARDRARQVGIILHPHETWVRPHARGVPDGIEMRFRWHAPSELKLSVQTHEPG